MRDNFLHTWLLEFDMQFLFEFLPELTLLLKKIQKGIDKVDFLVTMVIFTLFLLNIYVFQIVFVDVICISALLCYALYKIAFNTKFHLNQEVDTIEKIDVKLVQKKISLNTSYQSELAIKQQEHRLNDEIKLITQTVVNVTYFKFKNKRVDTKPIYHLTLLCTGLIFTNKVMDNADVVWRLKVYVWGIFKPKYIVKIEHDRVLKKS